MKIEKVKARTLYLFDGQEFGTLREAQRASLVAFLGSEEIADKIIGSPDIFRFLANPFLYKPRGRKPKAVQFSIELGEDGEPQVAEAA